MVAIVDCGGGNCASVARAFERLGAEVRLTSDAAAVAGAEQVVLPGVGHFGALMAALDARGLRQPLIRRARARRPLLGICLGLQALYQGSDEAPGVAGLGLLPGRARRLPASSGWRIPNVGWCQAGGDWFYFTHSYYLPPDEATTRVARAAVPFAAAIERGGIVGTQFHPEKSGAAGMEWLRAFLAAKKPEPLRRLIACLDVRAGRVVKGVQFQQLRDCGDPAELARAHAESGADEIFLLDITATAEARSTRLDTVRRVARELSVPLGVGGGVASVADAAALLGAGADKVSVNSAALARPELIAEMAARFGAQAVVAAIDVQRRSDSWEVMARAGQAPTGRDALAWARDAAGRGAGEILLTSMDRDGGQRGFDCALTAAVAATAVDVPVIASGGGGRAEDFVEVLTRGGASAALAASIFHDRRCTANELKRSLAAAGIAVRLEER